MKEKSKGSKNLLWQYFASYLAVMLTVMVLLMSYAYNSFYNFHTQILKSNYTHSLGLLRENNETELSRLLSITGQFTAMYDFSPFVFQENPGKAVRLTNMLGVFCGSNDFVRGLYLHFFEDSYVFSGTSLYLLDNFINRTAMFEMMTREELVDRFANTQQITTLCEQGVQGYLFNTQDANTQVVPVFVPVSYSSGVRCGTVLYLVDKMTYLDIFHSLGLSGYDLYILDGDEPLVSQSINGVPGDKVVAALTNGKIHLEHEGKSYTIFEVAGQTLRYRYAMLVSKDEMTIAMMDTLRVFLLVCAVIFAFGILLITRFVQLRIKPIRLLHSMLLNQESSGNELIEIRDSVQRLIDEHSQLAGELTHAEAHKKAHFAMKLLKGEFESEDEYLSEAEGIRLNVDTRYYVVTIMAKPTGSDYEMAPDKLNYLFDESVSGVCRALNLKDKVAFVSFADDAQLLYTWWESKFMGIRACCTGMTIAIGSVHADYREGPLAYLEAENAFESRFVRGNMSVIHFDEKWHAGGSQAKANSQAVERLRQALRIGDGARVRGALDDISRQMRGMNMSLFGFRCMYNDILSVITNEVRTKGTWERDIYDIFSLSECLSLDDLDETLYKACSRLIGEQDKGRQEPQDVSAEIAKAMLLMRKHFGDPNMSVSAIAASLGMSDSKLSVEFAKAYQMKPLEYLTMQRMRCACRLLYTTDMPVKDIAMECGYFEISGFNRRFKAYTGITPRQYRQKREKGENENADFFDYSANED